MKKAPCGPGLGLPATSNSDAECRAPSRQGALARWSEPTSRRPRHETRQPVASGTQHETEVLDQVIVRFAGDSGDGMQLTGDRFTTSSALMGNDLSTFPDFPAEIRAPAGTVNGV